MKKSWLLFVIVVFGFSLSLVSSSKTASPLLVQGYVSDSVLGNLIVDKDLEIVVTTEIGSLTYADTKFSEPGGNHADGHYDAVVYAFPGNKVTVSAKIKGTGCSGSITETAPGGQDMGLMDVNVDICCFPSKAIDLSPAGSKHFNVPEEVYFSWVSGSKGNPDYPELWEDFRGPENRNDVESPVILTISKLDKWYVKTCNGIKGGQSCCSQTLAKGDSSNKPCSKPFNLVGKLEGGYVVTTWESSGIDSEGDVCHDVWEAISLDRGDSVLNPAWTGDSDPANKEGELALSHAVTFWKVKSCDELGACSSWAIEITPSCNQISNNCPDVNSIERFLGGGKDNKIINEILGGEVGGSEEENGNEITDLYNEILQSKTRNIFLLIIKLIIASSIIYYEYQYKKLRGVGKKEGKKMGKKDFRRKKAKLKKKVKLKK